MNKGFTLIDIIVGMALMVIIFLGIFGAYQLGLQVIRQSAHRIVATSLANEYLERARNLAYADVGVDGQFPDGVFTASEVVTRNTFDYTVETDIDYFANDADDPDSCLNDYKRALFTVNWAGQSSGSVSLATDVAPANDIQECAQTGGMLSLTIFDALGVPVSAADILVEDVFGSAVDTCVTNADGVCPGKFLLASSTPGQEENYKVTVGKFGFSDIETFRAGDIHNGHTITTPDPANATIFDGQITVMSLAIDRLGDLTVYTRGPKQTGSFPDTFNDASGIAASSSIEITGGAVQLAKNGGDYVSPGQVVSKNIDPSNVTEWDEVVFSAVTPANTSLKISVLYDDGTNWVLIPDADLPGNAAGFAISPIDLSGLSAQTYGAIRLQADLETADPAGTPQLQDWQVNYFTALTISSAEFHMHGAKTVGDDASSQPIWKYDQTHTSAGGAYSADIEWDNYTFSTNPAANLDLQDIHPSPQPVAVNPGDNTVVTLYLDAQDSLLVTVEDNPAGNPVFGANVRLSSAGYDETQNTDENGQTLFIPLDPDLYNIEVSATGYASSTDTVSVSGDDTLTTPITQNPS